MGLWKLNTIKLKRKLEDNFKGFVPSPIANLFLRWDNTFVQQLITEKKEFGIYKIDGHKSEISMIKYNDELEFKCYKFSISENKLVPTSTKAKEEIIYSRINQFPQ